MIDKLIVVTRKTRLQELLERFNTRGQARFYIEHAGGNFEEYEREDDVYRASLRAVVKDLSGDLKLHHLDRSLVSTYLFSERDLIVVLGQDGLVANVAKYTGNQPIVAVNPDPVRNAGILLPYSIANAAAGVHRVIAGSERVRRVTLAEAALNDGQVLLAFNDLFIGVKSHTSARYRLCLGDARETQSSSGVIVSTGAGSTGWLTSAYQMASGLAKAAGLPAIPAPRIEWEERRLSFVVREPFPGRNLQTDLVSGQVEGDRQLVIESLMPSGGVIFSDGVEGDFLEFNSGAVASIRNARQCACLATPP